MAELHPGRKSWQTRWWLNAPVWKRWTLNRIIFLMHYLVVKIKQSFETTHVENQKNLSNQDHPHNSLESRTNFPQSWTNSLQISGFKTDPWISKCVKSMPFHFSPKKPYQKAEILHIWKIQGSIYFLHLPAFPGKPPNLHIRIHKNRSSGLRPSKLEFFQEPPPKGLSRARPKQGGNELWKLVASGCNDTFF